MPIIELPRSTLRPATTETPPKAGEIHIVRREWGVEISFAHRGRIERMDVCAYVCMGVTPTLPQSPTPTPPYAHTPILEISDADARVRVAARIAQIETQPDLRAEKQAELDLHEEIVARLRAELSALPAQGEGGRVL